MKPTRRGFIKTIAFGILGKGVISSFPRGANAKPDEFEKGLEIEKGYVTFNPETQKSLEALADTVLPGAKEIGIRAKFMNYFKNNIGLAGYFDAGIWNLDTISKQKFKKPYYQLKTKEEIDAVLKHVASRGSNRQFLKNFKDITVRLYYSSPEVWKSLSYSGPPQPRGFMNYSEPANKSPK